MTARVQMFTSPADRRLRLHTLVRLRWLAVIGQLAAISIVSIGLGFQLPLAACLTVVAVSAWINVILSIRYPARFRLPVNYATGLLAYDIVQLTALLYLTGGIDNPFVLLLVAPVTVSAATLPPVNTVMLGSLGIFATIILAIWSLPLPWEAGVAFELPPLYRAGLTLSVMSGMIFLGLYTWRLTKEGRDMSAALSATELVLAREQKLHALDGLAAAAAHELGTPLSTITLVTNELERQLGKDSPILEDIQLLRAQAQRCRDILRKLTREPAEQDPHYTGLLIQEMLSEAAEPYQGEIKKIRVVARPFPHASGGAAAEPLSERKPGVIYGFGNILENAIDFAETRVDVLAEWDQDVIAVTISDDGPGFKPSLIDALGEPYVTTRPAGSRVMEVGKSGVANVEEAHGLGLGFFIAKTLLERSGARLSLENRAPPAHGAIVRISWPRRAFESAPAAVEPAAAAEIPASSPPSR
ncbi:MAG: ActS/PrrB/RegB family redox-sensitive histidine kinase [Hyphomicrobium sp.]